VSRIFHLAVLLENGDSILDRGTFMKGMSPITGSKRVPGRGFK